MNNHQTARLRNFQKTIKLQKKLPKTKEANDERTQDGFFRDQRVAAADFLTVV